VETDLDLALLNELGCDQAQGYYIGRPMPLAALLEYLDERAGAYGSDDDVAAVIPLPRPSPAQVPTPDKRDVTG